MSMDNIFRNYVKLFLNSSLYSFYLLKKKIATMRHVNQRRRVHRLIPTGFGASWYDANLFRVLNWFWFPLLPAERLVSLRNEAELPRK